MPAHLLSSRSYRLIMLIWQSVEEGKTYADMRRERASDADRTPDRYGRRNPPVLGPGLNVLRIAGAGLRARARAAARRKARGLSRYSGPHRARRRVLSASPRLVVVWTERRIGASLRLSRLEIRCRRQMPRTDERTRAVLPQSAADRLPDSRDWRARLGLYGAAREDAGAAGLRMDAGAGNSPACVEGVGRV